MSSKQCGRVMMLFAVFQCDGWVPSSVVEWWCYLLCFSAMDEFQAVWSSDDVICCVSVWWMSSKQCGRVMMLFAVFQCDGWVPSGAVEWWCYLLRSLLRAMDEFQAVWSSDDVICCVPVRWMSSKQCGRVMKCDGWVPSSARVMMLFAVFQCDGWVPSSAVEWWCYLLCFSAMDEFQAVWSSDDVICCVQCDGWVPSSAVEWWCYLLRFSAMDEFQAVRSSWMSSKQCGRVMMLFAAFQCDGWVPSGVVEWWCYLLCSSAMDEFQAVWSSDDVICCVSVRWMSSKQCGRVMMLFAVCDGWVPSSVVEWWCYLLCFSAMDEFQAVWSSDDVICCVDEFQAVWSSDDVICCVSVRWMSSKLCGRVMMLFAVFQCDGWVPSCVMVEWWCYLLCFSAMDAVRSSDDVICCVSVRWMSSKQCGRVMMLFAVFQCDGWVPSSVVEWWCYSVFQCDGWVPSSVVEWWCYLLCSSAMDEFQAVRSSDDVICCVPVRWMSSKRCGRVMMLFAVFQCDGWVPSSVVEWWCY